MNKEQVKNIMVFIGSKNQNYKYERGNSVFNSLLKNTENPYETYKEFEDIYVLDNDLLDKILIGSDVDIRYRVFEELMESGKIDFELSVSNLRKCMSSYMKLNDSLEVGGQFNLFKSLVSNNNTQKTSDLLYLIEVFMNIEKKRVLEMLVSEAPGIFEDIQIKHISFLIDKFKFVKDVKMTDILGILFKSNEFVERVSLNDDIRYSLFKYTNSVEWLYYRLIKLGINKPLKNLRDSHIFMAYLKPKMDNINKILNNEK